MEYLDRAVQWAEECDLEVPFWKLAGTKKLIGHCECLNSAGPQQSPSRVGCIQFPEWCFWFPWCFFPGMVFSVPGSVFVVPTKVCLVPTVFRVPAWVF